MLSLLALCTAHAGSDSELTWAVTLSGTPVGTRTAKVRIVSSDQGTRRVIESFTELSGTLGPLDVKYRQRLTANVVGSDPASFHSVVDENGVPSEIQGRWSPSGWVVTTNVAGRSRTVEYPVSKIDFSTADLLDPESRIGWSSLSRARVLNTLTGQVLDGPVESRGGNEVSVGGTKVAVDRYAWLSPEGPAVFDFSAEGYLVRFEMPLMGMVMTGVLTAPPPGGIDDFPVAVGRPKVDVLPL